ncbi:Uncharacterised protein [Serratia fonticola]|uniref:Uncharacterized protein n=1 Tax=Serratia fonticola TaxID=47917 RepID=A0A4U9WFA1_SERFO|nr:Uncharacterised protein [Serratia fonticola]
MILTSSILDAGNCRRNWGQNVGQDIHFRTGHKANDQPNLLLHGLTRQLFCLL